MKKIIILASIIIVLASCSDQQMARSFGGTETVTLKPGQRLINITWKGNESNASLWILTKQDTTKPTTYSFKEKSAFGAIEGEVIIKEQ